MRSFKGDLHYEPEAGGSTFVVQLSPSLRESKNDSYEQQNSSVADRRSQPVPGEPQPASPDRADFHIVGTCASATEALALPQLRNIDVVLLDYDLGHEQGTQFLDRAGSCGFTGRVLMVTAGMSDGVMLRTLENGSHGVFLNTVPRAAWWRPSERWSRERYGSTPQ